MSALRAVPDVDPNTGEVIPPTTTDDPKLAAALAECTRLRGLLFTAEQDNRRLEKDLRTWREKYERSLEDKDAKLRADKNYSAALDLIDEWKRECGHPKARVDHARIRLAMSAVKLYKDNREALSWVIQYGKHLAYVDERGTRHDGLGLLFRDAEHIERYANSYVRWSRQNGERHA